MPDAQLTSNRNPNMNTKEKFVITISREIGSGGHTIGCELARKLGIRFYDKELINELMQRFNLTAEQIEKLKAQKKGWLSDFINKLSPAPNANLLIDADSPYTRSGGIEVTTDDIYKAEVEIINALAEESSCVFAGRSGFFVLKDHPNKFDIFITAPKESRIARVMIKQRLPKEEAQDLVEAIDKSRESFVKRYTGQSRYDLRNYDLCLDVGAFPDLDKAVDHILEIIRSTEH